MRKGQRFTPARLERWRLNERGIGTGSGYQPWHQVTRDDPGSRGRSHLIPWRFGRLHHLLSDQELVAFGFASMLAGLHDLREQFPLSIDEHPAEIRAYQTGASSWCPGTLEIAADLGIKHPVARGAGESCPWVMSTDLVVTRTTARTTLALLAISVKLGEDLKRDRTRELLRIEREYWERQGQPWLLITPELHDPFVATAIRFGLPWALQPHDHGVEQALDWAAVVAELDGLSMRHALGIIGAALGVDLSNAQAALWRAVWRGDLPMNLARPIRPDQPLEFLSREAFWQQNPIASGRSAWTH
jgi:hypothetical protein